ncbi:MAG TPA: cation-translocating P-type ATPase [Candidatus Methylacidiphilales bacterium]|nr:cation-translocating P-type ATPase [Candidatus Methylacidiphilales bacterium]
MSACCSPGPSAADVNASCAAPGAPGAKPSPEVVRAWFRAGLAGMIAFQSMMFGLGINLAGTNGPERLIIHCVLAVAAVGTFIIVSGPLLSAAFSAMRARRVCVEQLFLAGIIGAFAASVLSTVTGVGSVYYEVVAILLAVYSLGQLLVDNQKRAAFRAAAALEEAFRFCRRLETGAAGSEAVSVPVREMKTGERFLVSAGEAIPLDGRVVQGVAYVRQAAITGEAFPVVKRVGDSVIGGSHSVDDTLIIEATTDGTQRRIDAMLQSLQAARERPSAWALEADRITAWFLPMVLGVAVLTAAIWIPISGWAAGLFNALAVVLVACPCALGLATPIAIWSALNALGARGIIARSGDVVERLASTDYVVFDKTGTLSEDEVRIVDFICADGFDRAQLYKWIAAVEARSTHPIARAFHAWIAPGSEAGEGKPAVSVSDTHVIPGVGLEGWVTSSVKEATKTSKIDRTSVSLGNEKLLEPRDSLVLSALRDRARIPEGARELYVKVDGKLAALGILRESLRPSVEQTFARLQHLGIPAVIMTGDTEESLRALESLPGAAALQSRPDSPGHHSSLTPEQKADLVRDLQQKGRRVLFVGDGINDAAAMATAHASIALSGGAELARESAAAQLFRGDLSAIPTGIAIARQVRDGLRRNMIFAIAYNALAIAMAASGWLHPVAAALVMLASSLTVTIRALHFAEKLRVLSEADLAAWFAEYAKTVRHRLDEERKRARSHSADSDTHNLAATDRDRDILNSSSSADNSWRALWHRADAACRPGLAPWIFAVCFAVQGPILTHLGQTDMVAYVLSGLTSLMAGLLVLHYWRALRYHLSWQMAISMLSAGNLAMLIGWWGDAGLGPIIREGVCLCGCATSPLGKGLWHPHYMHTAMVLGSLPAMALVSDGSKALAGSAWQRWRHSIFLTIGMLAGMMFSGYIISCLRLPDPQVEFFFSYFAMSVGMVLGMFAACAVWRERRVPQQGQQQTAQEQVQTTSQPQASAASLRANANASM